MSKNPPKVSVVLPAYNEAAGIRRAVDSLLCQTLNDLEVIAIDDGSTDETGVILRSYSDPRLIVVSQNNQGLVRTLNQGIMMARAPYIARLDADDWCVAERLAVQLAFLESHPECGMIGSWCKLMWEGSGAVTDFRVPLTDRDIRRRLVWENPFVHSTVMLRKAGLLAVGLYNPSYRWEDYELWWRVLNQSKGANLPAFLVTRLVRERSLGSVSKTRYYADKWRVQQKAKNYLSTPPTIYASLLKTATAYGLHRCADLVVDMKKRI